MDTTQGLLTAKDVKQILRVSLPFVYKLADRGVLPAMKYPCQGVGQKKRQFLVRFKPEDVQAFIESHYK